MEFWKMNGAGNDFIVVDDRQDAIADEKWPEIIRAVCERHMSIGADGLMVEVHNHPEKAWCDGQQSITPEAFDDLAKAVRDVLPHRCREEL